MFFQNGKNGISVYKYKERKEQNLWQKHIYTTQHSTIFFLPNEKGWLNVSVFCCAEKN